MNLSVARSTLQILHKLPQQARWLKEQNKMSIGGRKCILFYLIRVLRAVNQAQLESFSKIFELSNAMWLYPLTSLLWHTKKVVIYL